MNSRAGKYSTIRKFYRNDEGFRRPSFVEAASRKHLFNAAPTLASQNKISTSNYISSFSQSPTASAATASASASAFLSEAHKLTDKSSSSIKTTISFPSFNGEYTQIESFEKGKNEAEKEVVSKTLKIKTHAPSADISPFSPETWGPSYWLVLHTGSLKYPEQASNVIAERMRGYILGLPYIIPCENCSEHAKEYIDANMHKLEKITSGRENLFNFFVDLHNQVNRRHNKPEFTYKEAREKYGNETKVVKITYE
jgi:hypothetical protein